jgi:hypothetical protein
MHRRLRLVALPVALATIVVATLVPSRAPHTAAPPATVVRGAYHIHSDRSDGSGSLEEIAAAAARAGLQFIIVTDHGDGTRPPAAPAFHHGVLTIDAVELGTDDGHVVALDMAAAPYPLAGTAADVLEDVHRLNGFAVAAHPASARPSLRWRNWETAIDGLEWLNGDSEWRDEPLIPLARALLTYPWRPPETMARLFDRPADTMARWDRLVLSRRLVGLAAVDAHARLGWRDDDPDRSAVHVPVPSYESTFRVVSNHVVLESPLSDEAATAAAQVIGAVRAGRVYSVVDALGTPGHLAFTATSGDNVAGLGDDLPVTSDVLLRAEAAAPPGTTLVLLKNGQSVHEVTNGVLETNGGTDAAVYRIEAYTADPPGGPPVPWLVSSPIYAGISRPVSMPATREPVSRMPARMAEAAAEKGSRDSSVFERPVITDPRARQLAGEPPMVWTFTLADGEPSGQFAAIALPLSPGLDAYDRVRFTAVAQRPMRAWVQLRASGRRWGATFFADATERMIDLPFARFRPIDAGPDATPPLDRMETLLFVVDTLNALPGTTGTLTLGEVALVR